MGSQHKPLGRSIGLWGGRGNKGFEKVAPARHVAQRVGVGGWKLGNLNTYSGQTWSQIVQRRYVGHRVGAQV